MPDPFAPNSIEALGEALGASPQQLDALRDAANENKQRFAEIFLTPSHDGEPAPAHYILDQIARGVDLETEIGRGLIAKYLNACVAPDGSTHLDALGRANRASLAMASAALSEEQAQKLRELASAGLNNFDTGSDPLGEAMRTAVRPSSFATWDDFLGAGEFSEAVSARLLDEFTVLKEQLSAVLQSVPAEGGESPMDYQARLMVASDPVAAAALDRYLDTRTDPAFGRCYREVLQRAERERMLRIVLGLKGTARGQFQRLWNQSLMSLRLPNDRFDALLARKIQALKSHRTVEHDGGLSPMSWAEFCRALLLTSAQEPVFLAQIRGLQTEEHMATVETALAAEANVRAFLATHLAPGQLRRWNALGQRSFFSIQLPA